jgi:hypothetical protein
VSSTQSASAQNGFAFDMENLGYEGVIRELNRTLDPRTYLEIGTNAGTSLQIPSCKCIAIDPKFHVEQNVIGNKLACHFYQIGSDRFFADHNPEAILGGPIDMAFLDGMHLFEFLLRDFFNTERFCRRNSVIMMHDCIPSDTFMTSRIESDHDLRQKSVAPEWWTGDVWKVVAILNKYRPDLVIYPISASPTGLIVITNLNPQSVVLSDNYFSIVEEFSAGSASEPTLEKYLNEMQMIAPRDFLSVTGVASRMWL